MRSRVLLCTLPLLAALVLAAPARAQEGRPALGSSELLVGVGLGSRENNWHALDQSRLRAVVLMAAIRRATRHPVRVELEATWWQEETARFAESAITTHIVSLGGNLFLQPHLGPLDPRAGVGLALGHHFDTGTSPLSETTLGANVHAGAELDLSSRLGAYVLGRAEQWGTWSLVRGYGGVRIRLGS